MIIVIVIGVMSEIRQYGRNRFLCCVANYIIGCQSTYATELYPLGFPVIVGLSQP